MRIQNNNDYTLTPEQQQAIENGATNMGVDQVNMSELFEDEDGVFAPVYTLEDHDNEYFLFCLNMKTLELSERYPKHLNRRG
jgi:hypothetical protein